MQKNYISYCGRWHNINLTIYSCGSGILKNDDTFKHDTGKDFSLAIVSKGNAIVFFDNREYYVETGQGYVVVPSSNCTVMAKPDSNCTIEWVSFNGFFAERYLLRARLSAKKPVFSYKRDDEMIRRFQKLVESSKIKYNRYCKMLSLLYEIVSCLIDEEKDKQDYPKLDYGTQDYIWNAMRFIDDHYSENITIVQIAEHLGITRKYFSHIFHELVHISPQEYLINIRMQKACELLRNNKNSVTETAMAVGYSDPFHFSKMFKKRIGLSPSEFLQTSQGKNILREYQKSTVLDLNATLAEKDREIESLKKIIAQQKRDLEDTRHQPLPEQNHLKPLAR